MYRTRRHDRRILTASITSILALSASAYAQRTWDGEVSQNWNDPLNWSGNVFPAGQNAIINTATGLYPIISATPTAGTPVDIFVGSGAGATGRLDHTAGTAATGNGNWFFVGANGGTGIYNLANTAAGGGSLTGFGLGTGSLTVGRFNVGGAEFNGSGTGTVNINTSGTLTANAGNGVAFTVAYEASSTGTVNLDNGTINATGGELWVGKAGNGTFNQSGGTVASNGYLVLGRDSGSVGTYNLSGGTVNAATAFGFTSIGSARGSTGILSVNGTGVFNSNAGIILGEAWTGTGTASGTLNVSGGGLVSTGVAALQLGANSGGAGTVNLNGGTIQVGSVTQGGGTGTINFNGGTLKSNASSATFVTGLSSALVKAGGAKFDTNSFNVTVGQALLADAASTGGGLSKSGAGTLTLTGTSTYTGATNVLGGTLALAGGGSINSSSLILINGLGAKFLQTSDFNATPAITVTQGTLDGSGRVGAVTVGAGTGGIIANGNGTTAQLTLGSLAFNGAGTMKLNIAGGSSTFVPALNVGSSLTTLGGAGSVTVNLTPTDPLLIGSAYRLIGYQTSFAGNTTDFVYGGNTARVTGVFGNTDNYITLTLNGDAPKWTGLDNGDWKLGATGSSANWVLQTAGTPTNYQEGDLVLFDETATGTRAVNIAGANVSPSVTTFDNSGDAYTVSSAGGFGISGTGSVIKNGPGKVIFSTANTTSGPVAINAGTLQLNDGGSFSNSSGITNQSVLAYNIVGSQTFANVITGFGAVTKSGSGTVILTGSNTYSGGTFINAGILQVTNSVGPANAGSIYLNGGTFQVNLGAGNDFNYAPTINLSATSTIGNAAPGAAGNLNGQINFTGGLYGDGVSALNVANSGLARLYLNGVVSGVGQINVQSGAMGFDLNFANLGGGAPVNVANGAALWVAGANNTLSNNLTFNGGSGINEGGALYYEGGSPTPASLTGLITLAGGDTSVGAAFANDRMTLAGQITGPGALTKATGNTYVLSGQNSYAGGTTIAAGAINAAANSALGTGPVAISALVGAQLQLANGVDVANLLTINGGGITGQGALYVPVGNATYSGAISINGAQNAGGHFATAGGTLTIAGTVTSASVPVRVRAGTVAFSNPNSSFGSLEVIGGTAKLAATNAIPVGATVTIGTGGTELNAVFDLGGFNQTLAGIAKGAQSAKITNSGGFDSLLTTTGASAFAGLIQDGATNKTALAIDGGELTLSGANTFTGNVAVNFGVLFASSGIVGNPTATALGNNTVAGRRISVSPGAELRLATNDVFGNALAVAANLPLLVVNGTLSTARYNQIGALVLNGGTLTSANTTDQGEYQNFQFLGSVTVGGSAVSTIGSTSALEFSGNHLGVATTFDVENVTGDPSADLIVSAPFRDQSGNYGAAPGSVVKTGAGTMQISAVNTYTGLTTIEAGTLILTGSISGTTAITVKSGAVFQVSDVAGGFTLAAGQTLRGDGTVIGPVALATGSKLAPGGTFGTLAFLGNLDISLAVMPSASAALQFDLGSMANSDKVAFATGALNLGTDLLGFDDFAFTTSAGFGSGTYTLFDGTAPIIGSLDSANLSGFLGDGLLATLTFAENGNDLVLTVVPEPGSATLLVASVSAFLGLRRFRRRSA